MLPLLSVAGVASAAFWLEVSPGVLLLCAVAAWTLFFFALHSAPPPSLSADELRSLRLARLGANVTASLPAIPSNNASPGGSFFFRLFLCLAISVAFVFSFFFSAAASSPSGAIVAFSSSDLAPSRNKNGWPATRDHWLYWREHSQELITRRMAYQKLESRSMGGIWKKMWNNFNEKTGEMDRCASTVDALTAYFCGELADVENVQSMYDFADLDGIDAFRKLIKGSGPVTESFWIVNIFLDSDTGGRWWFVSEEDADHQSFGHVFGLHVHSNRTVDLYQSFIESYSLREHMILAEGDGRPWTGEMFEKLYLRHFETLVRAESWSDAENDAYRAAFRFDVNAHPRAALGVLSLSSTNPIQMRFLLACSNRSRFQQKKNK